MNLLVPVIQGLVQVVSAILAWKSSKKLPETKRRKMAMGIVYLSIFTIALTTWQSVSAKIGSEDSTRKTVGDADHPPYLAAISLPNFTRFIVTNTSGYPA